MANASFKPFSASELIHLAAVLDELPILLWPMFQLPDDPSGSLPFPGGTKTGCDAVCSRLPN